MKTPGPIPPQQGEKILVRTPDYDITTAPHGNWFVTTVRGRYDDKILDILRTDVFRLKTSFAFDLSGLNGITVQLARELYFLSNKLKTTDFRLVLISPGDKIRSLVGLIAPGAKISHVAGAEELPADPKALEGHLARMDQALDEIKKNLQTNPLWAFVDRESCWLCPFCGQLAEGVKIVSRVSISAPVVEQLYKHLHRRCPSYSPANPKYKPQADLEAKLKASNSEKVSVSRQFTASLETKVRQLEDKANWADSLEQGLKIAVDRQKRLLPAKAPDIEGCETALIYRPAQHVSGDFYDFIDMGQGRIGFSIGDVAGHGIEAGILMGMTKKVINIRASELMDPVAAMKKVNADVYKELDRQTFVTAFLGMYDPATKLLSYARAGHNPPILFNKNRNPHTTKFEAGGLMLGMSLDAIFSRAMQGQTIQLQSGDVILFYTDGLEEAHNPEGDLFSLARCFPILESECERPASFILGALSVAVDKFTGPVAQEDDITAVCLKIL